MKILHSLTSGKMVTGQQTVQPVSVLTASTDETLVSATSWESGAAYYRWHPANSSCSSDMLWLFSYLYIYFSAAKFVQLDEWPTSNYFLWEFKFLIWCRVSNSCWCFEGASLLPTYSESQQQRKSGLHRPWRWRQQAPPKYSGTLLDIFGKIQRIWLIKQDILKG